MRFDKSPAALGFWMPAEWDVHARTWMAWPCRPEIWDGEDGLFAARIAFARTARTIAEFESVVMVARPEDAREAELACGRGVEIMPFPIDDSWARDTSAIFLVDAKDPAARRVAGVDFQFNAWGRNHPNYAHDDALAGALLEHLRMLAFKGPMVLEGGSIAVDGEGTLLTTEECLLNENRNPELSRQQIEERLAMFLGVRRVLWLPHGFDEDETDGHVDNVAAFVAPGRVALNWTDEESDANYRLMRANRRALEAVTDAHGRRIEVIEVPQPAVRRDNRGRLPASYLNFYIVNGGIIAPAFDDSLDKVAARLLEEMFPGRRVASVPAGAIIYGGGGIHCITHEEPAGVAAPREPR